MAEIVQEKIEEGHGHGERPPWTEHVAMAMLVIGVLSALAATLSALAANEATLQRVHETIDIVEQRGDRTELTVLEARHDNLLGAITLFSVAITLTGMSLMARRRLLWRIGMALGVVGGVVFLWGTRVSLLTHRHHPEGARSCDLR